MVHIVDIIPCAASGRAAIHLRKAGQNLLIPIPEGIHNRVLRLHFAVLQILVQGLIFAFVICAVEAFENKSIFAF